MERLDAEVRAAIERICVQSAGIICHSLTKERHYVAFAVRRSLHLVTGVYQPVSKETYHMVSTKLHAEEGKVAVQEEILLRQLLSACCQLPSCPNSV